MAYIKMVGDNSKYKGELTVVNKHIIEVRGLIQNLNGFRLYQDNDTLIGDYSKYIYAYEDPNLGEGIYRYSDNNAEYEGSSEQETKEQEELAKIESVVKKVVSTDIADMLARIEEIESALLEFYDSIGASEEVTDETESTTDTTESEETADDNCSTEENG